MAGYDPEAYLAQYRAAGGDINAMRREQYAKDRKRITAQKRAAYLERKLRTDADGGTIAIIQEIVEKPALLAAYTPSSLKQALE